MGKFSIEIKYAALFTIAMLAWTIGEKEAGFHDKNISSYLSVSLLSGIVGLVVYFFALFEKKRKYFQGTMTWAQGFVSGIFLSFFIALLSPLAQLIVFQAISPELLKNLAHYAVSHGGMTQKQAEVYFSFRSYAIQAAFTSLSVGVLTAALIALVLKTKPKADTK
ncbi:DUF4199 domain-containing protein [Flavobacterium silvaticum]|uniref:DUF4199 domain-containing protein n=1 Tax=Flavobacterium silvaticum TaxID=1852020 RepID=A0A972JHB5_9FLAO|nr:DUF4199 domain-containing protein [Flavobacterium silvaticum]NMH26953.1 DUF4199 domain-containing protein [Flavobacterium silvaticum]